MLLRNRVFACVIAVGMVFLTMLAVMALVVLFMYYLLALADPTNMDWTIFLCIVVPILYLVGYLSVIKPIYKTFKYYARD